MAARAVCAGRWPSEAWRSYAGATVRRSAHPRGDTSASRIKALALYTAGAHGEAAADALLSSVELSWDDIEAETRPLSIGVFHRALVAFVGRHGREALAEVWRGVVHEKNLGVWMRVLRDVRTPEGALSRFTELGGDEGKTTRWQTLESRPGLWRGRLTVDHDLRFEADGLLSLARQAELRAVPVLFGLEPATVRELSAVRTTFATKTGMVGAEVVVTWREEAPRSHVVPFVAAGVLAGGLVGHAASSVVAVPSALVAAVVGGVVGGCGGAGAWALRRRMSRAEVERRAKEMRLRALERSTLLLDDRSTLSGPLEGAVIAGLYRLGARLGAGASGVIHEAVRLSDDQPVAVKLLRAAVAHDAIASDRLRREAEAMGLAWHPNVVELYDQGALPDGTTYLVMELLDGEPLSARLQRGPLPEGEVVELMFELCDALAAIHAAGVIHRDLKPGNIFLCQARRSSGAQSVKVKALDFGIARVEWAETRLTDAEVAVGTPGYMSPEQEEGLEVDARSDLYALGAILFECLSGVPLRPAGRPSARARASGVHPVALAPAWRAVVEKATARQPRERYADAKAMGDAIAQAARATGEFARQWPGPDGPPLRTKSSG